MLKKKVELVNALTGLILVGVGIRHTLARNYDSSFSWIIFGCMYLAMGRYGRLNLKRGDDLVRVVGSACGLAASLGLVVYTLTV